MGDYDGKYAILSHTWEQDEVTFEEMVDASESSDPELVRQIRSKAGYIKIQQAARQAWLDGYQYIWVDTCCIQKSSSAELSEAINSMFRWYRKAGLCYAYLADVRDASPTTFDTGDYHLGFASSRWFTRGWTLQELIAPRHVQFYSRDWLKGAAKSNILDVLRKITGVSEAVMRTGDPSTECIAHRMSWAAHRATTRVEDMAYSLMGLFDVNMPLLYGEGDKAFQRLQEEICRRSDDQTLFAWRHRLAEGEEEAQSYSLYRGLFARSPKEFDTSEANEFYTAVNRFTPASSMTNVGFNIKVPLIPLLDAERLRLVSSAPQGDPYDSADEFLALLNFLVGPKSFDLRHPSHWHSRTAILLKQVVADQPTYVRIQPNIIYRPGINDMVMRNYTTRDIFIQQTPRIYDSHSSRRIAGFQITTNLSSGPPVLASLWSPSRGQTQYENCNALCLAFLPLDGKSPGVSGMLFIAFPTGRRLTMTLGLDESHPCPAFYVFEGVPENPEQISFADAQKRARANGTTYGREARVTQLSSNEGSGYSLCWKLSVEKDRLICQVNVNNVNLGRYTDIPG